MKFSISPAVFEKLPTACFGVVAVLDAVPSPEADTAIAARLAQAVTDCQAALAGVALKESPEILPYREAFRALGQNPNKYPCSIEALLTRIAKGKGMPSINTLVDLGNAVSLRHRLPIGAHDIATFRDGVLEVRPAVEGDRFLPFGGGGTPRSRRSGLCIRRRSAYPALDLAAERNRQDHARDPVGALSGGRLPGSQPGRSAGSPGRTGRAGKDPAGCVGDRGLH